MRAEADAKLAAVKPLADAYRALVADREEFTARDAKNVAAVRAARAAALKAGFTERALNEAGYRQTTELTRPATARKPAAKKTPATRRRTRKPVAAAAPPRGADAASRSAGSEQSASTG